MNNVKNQLNKNRKSRDEHKHEWFTENNNRNSYQAYRDTILNYLYYKKAHSSSETKHIYQRLFEILRNNPRKKAEIYLKILNEINNIPRKPNSDTYKEFLVFLDKLYAKYKKPEYENNFSIELINLIKKQKNNSNSNNNNVKQPHHTTAANVAATIKYNKIKQSAIKYLINKLKTINNSPETIEKIKRIIHFKRFKNDPDFEHYIKRINEKYSRLLK